MTAAPEPGREMHPGHFDVATDPLQHFTQGPIGAACRRGILETRPVFKSVRDVRPRSVKSFANSGKLAVGVAFGGDQSQPKTTAMIRTKPQTMGSLQAQSAPDDASREPKIPGTLPLIVKASRKPARKPSVERNSGDTYQPPSSDRS